MTSIHDIPGLFVYSWTKFDLILLVFRSSSLPASLCVLNVTHHLLPRPEGNGWRFVMEYGESLCFFFFPQSTSSSMWTSCWINPFISSLLPSTTASTVCVPLTPSWWVFGVCVCVHPAEFSVKLFHEAVFPSCNLFWENRHADILKNKINVDRRT